VGELRPAPAARAESVGSVDLRSGGDALATAHFVPDGRPQPSGA
jgi:hypothetical protein